MCICVNAHERLFTPPTRLDRFVKIAQSIEHPVFVRRTAFARRRAQPPCRSARGESFACESSEI